MKRRYVVYISTESTLEMLGEEKAWKGKQGYCNGEFHVFNEIKLQPWMRFQG